MNLKKLILFASCSFCFFGSFSIFASGHEDAVQIKHSDLVNVRVGKKIKTLERDIPDLISDKTFEGKYFTVLKGSTQEPVSFSDDPILKLRASTVYFHHSLARLYYKSRFPKLTHLDQHQTIRIDQNEPFSPAIHFVTSGKKQYNGALTVPASGAFKLASTEGWRTETWYFESKPIKRKSQAAQVTEALNTWDFKKTLVSQLLFQDVSRLGQQLMSGAELSWEVHLMSMALSLGLAEIVPEAAALIVKPFKQRYSLDTALIPEIALHEYGHFALEPVFSLKNSTPLNEGFPNYFASQILGLTKLGAHASRYNKGDMPKNGNSKSIYNLDQEETLQAAHGSFVFSLLTKLHHSLGDEGEKIIVGSLVHLKPESDIKTDFERAILLSIQENASSVEKSKLIAIRVFQEKGL